MMSPGSGTDDYDPIHDPIPETLKRALADQTVIPFIGAGVSRAVENRYTGRSLFPSWGELLERAADALHDRNMPNAAMAVRGLIRAEQNPDYLEAAKRAKDGLGVHWAEFLREMLDPSNEDAKPESLALPRTVWQLGSRCIITTNYDRVLKWASPNPGDHASWSTNPQAELAKLLQTMNLARWPKRPTVWHLHGHVDEINHLILAPDGYRLLYSSAECEYGYQAAHQSLRNLLVSRSFLFVGFSLDDADFIGVLRHIHQTFGGCGAQHYALIPWANAPVVEEKLSGLPIQILRYRKFGAPLLALVQRLCDSVPRSADSAARDDEESASRLAAELPAPPSPTAMAGSPTAPVAPPSHQSEHRSVTSSDRSRVNTQLADHFLDLSPQAREDIARKLGLLPNDYKTLNRVALAKRIFVAAREHDQLAALWAEVEALHPDGMPLPNPYAR